MATPSLGPYRVRAYNTAHDSENRIHDTHIARTLGFAGGLVPGVDVYAYMTHLALARWGADWLAAGTMTARYASPVYDGEDALVFATEEDGALVLSVRSRDEVCATGGAALGTPPAVNAVAAPPPPDPANRPVASHDTLAPGRVLGIRPLATTPESALAYLRDVRETDPTYRRDSLLHPGLLLRTCNMALLQNVRLGPWIHTGNTVQNLAPAQVGSTLSVAATITGNETRKGHDFVSLDALVMADGTPVCQIAYTAIWRPRALRPQA